MNSTKSTNGRVNIIKQTPDISKLFDMYDKIPANQCATFREPTAGLWTKSNLSNAFFSEQNIQIIQNGIRSGVYKKSNGQYTVAPQDCDPLKIVMRSIFLQHSVNQIKDVAGQINSLNQMVLDFCINAVYSEAQGYIKYLHDVSTLAVPMSNPIMPSQCDKKTHKMPDWF
jgi:hypothetical protein